MTSTRASSGASGVGVRCRSLEHLIRAVKATTAPLVIDPRSREVARPGRWESVRGDQEEPAAVTVLARQNPACTPSLRLVASSRATWLLAKTMPAATAQPARPQRVLMARSPSPRSLAGQHRPET